MAKYHDCNVTIVMYVNKVGPYFNPHETYHYYSLPVCRPEKIEHKSLSLGEVLDGDRMAVSLYEILFKKDEERKTLCKVVLKEADVQQLRSAIEDLYYFEFAIDQLPLRGFIGRLEEGSFLPHHHEVYLWVHLHFNIEYNGDQIIAVNVSTKEHQPVKMDEDIHGSINVTFTYSVKWFKTDLPYEQRAKRLSDNRFFPKTLEIHWLSIINSMVLVFLLIGFVVIILTRVLKNDFARYNMDDEELDDLDQDDNGWKTIHTDVFRFPRYKSLFCSILGVGAQFLALATGILLMALCGLFNVHKHGSMNTASVILYAFTSWIAGYVSSRMYKRMNGENWVWNVNLTTCLFGAPFFVIWSVENTVAWAYHSTQALPATTIILLGAMWIFGGYPLTVLGGIFGKNFAGGFDAPCRTKNIPRELPEVPWYRSAFAHMLIGGFLPFSAISVELYYIFATVWGREQYTLYGVLFVVFGILISVTMCVSIALTYFQLSTEDYRWWWRSIFSAGSTGASSYSTRSSTTSNART
ncbi:PREDICTED: transmembrane 9 superfamily member 1-like isoform X2 [Priapulus caudatus]|uniref:Transmembrane 9 superfamily member n=1 Tax=Priapulus caudatus TaxID=37621 RepID=A0ABM1EB03_PRICU|nr:PREDICTED: transmembrane 9 superfamily member 1-like isoform X2 [Priapulus caudatus]